MLGTSKPERDGWRQKKKHSVNQVSLFDLGKSLPNFINFSSLQSPHCKNITEILQNAIFASLSDKLALLRCAKIPQPQLATTHELRIAPAGTSPSPQVHNGALSIFLHESQMRNSARCKLVKLPTRQLTMEPHCFFFWWSSQTYKASRNWI